MCANGLRHLDATAEPPLPHRAPEIEGQASESHDMLDVTNSESDGGDATYVFKYGAVDGKTKHSRRKRNPGSDIPDLIIQVGAPRTATTLQFQALCATIVLLKSNVTCKFATQLQESVMGTKTGTFNVFKTHSFDEVREVQTYTRRPFWVFATGVNATAGLDGNVMDWGATAEQLEEGLNLPLKYVQIQSILTLRGYLMVGDYAEIFSLSDAEKKEMLHYMRHWTVLRQCCGPQLSQDWRNKLQGKNSTRSRSDPNYPACEVYNMDALESALLDTDVFKRMRENKNNRIETGDWPFNGTYCSWFNW
eukprot:CAMPEP_0168387484 /NCGR_PEP_ID=MMETSP0228-20121227/15969_1 /TAXON_ID=133427 /ORGANISM="Protoceratium reticulatum, Strain CCCM 535 (=CCMP 1889)" /LENGTH=305 /DNA_ID=CAMNT_0008400721 /DNA_START=91 /DNA_END=1005 /DNA_ORIENTATION=+